MTAPKFTCRMSVTFEKIGTILILFILLGYLQYLGA
jgi:hypothetical protein